MKTTATSGTNIDVPTRTPELRARRVYLFAIGFVTILFPVNLILTMLGMMGDYTWVASVFIVLYAITTVLSEMRFKAPSTVLREFVYFSIVVFFVEVLGLHSGYPFGDHLYTDRLGFVVLGVPLAIPSLWYTTVMNSWRFVRGILNTSFPPRSLRVAISAAVIMLAMDLVIEPVAASVIGYWAFQFPKVPKRHYASWLVFTTAFVVWLGFRREGEHHALPERMFNALIILGMLWIQFAMIDVTNGYIGHVVASVALFLAVWWSRDVGIRRKSMQE